MPFDEALANRVRSLLKSRRHLAEKKMFGGLCFTLNGNMCCGVDKSDLIVRIDPERHEYFVSRPHAREFNLSKMKFVRGWLLVNAKGTSSEGALKEWVGVCVEYAASLPAKKVKKKRA